MRFPIDLQERLRTFVDSAPRPLIVVLGPTASGKTELSLDIAEWIAATRACTGVDIVNADSRQIYAKLDIGTAKIRASDMRGIPHHLLSVLDPKEPVTIAWYQDRAKSVIDSVHARGSIPLLVGGSMLYISAIIDGLMPVPPSDDGIRTLLQEAYDRDGGVALHAELARYDPEAAQAIPRQNSVYLIRAMERWLITGKKQCERQQIAPCPYDLFLIGIAVRTNVLAVRINDRTAVLLSSGWIEEVRALREQGYTPEDPGLTSHGYPEIMEWISVGGDISSLCERIASKTRQYAKRQKTWWKSDERIHWIER